MRLKQSENIIKTVKKIISGLRSGILDEESKMTEEERIKEVEDKLSEALSNIRNSFWYFIGYENNPSGNEEHILRLFGDLAEYYPQYNDQLIWLAERKSNTQAILYVGGLFYRYRGDYKMALLYDEKLIIYYEKTGQIEWLEKIRKRVEKTNKLFAH
ncbi:MAG: hypothetical protein ACM3PE_10065 [Deltaproteobacteria bacterium]